MRSLAAAFALGFAAFAQAQVSPPRVPPADEGRVVDRAVALVAGQVITQSELEVETRVALIQAGGVEAATAALDDAALKASLDEVITERLENAEADKLQAYPLDD